MRCVQEPPALLPSPVLGGTTDTRRAPAPLLLLQISIPVGKGCQGHLFPQSSPPWASPWCGPDRFPRAETQQPWRRQRPLCLAGPRLATAHLGAHQLLWTQPSHGVLSWWPLLWLDPGTELWRRQPEALGMCSHPGLPLRTARGGADAGWGSGQPREGLRQGTLGCHRQHPSRGAWVASVHLSPT